MYGELYKAWRNELENAELVRLPSDFYSRIGDYARKLRDESRMLDKRTAKASLLTKEMQNVKHMVHELIQTRCAKLVKKMAKERVTAEGLTLEEEKICADISSFFDAFDSLTKNILRGHGSKIGSKQEHRRTALRFLKDVPAIVGSDMKAYGPFKVEDVASLPLENAKILVKQGLAEEVETT